MSTLFFVQVTPVTSQTTILMGTPIALQSPRLQTTSTPTPTLAVADSISSTSTPIPTLAMIDSTPFSITFAELGFDQESLNSPVDRASYSFRLPPTWVVQEGSFVEFDLSYIYNVLDNNVAVSPDSFGNLTVRFDNTTVSVLTIKDSQLDHYRFRVPLAASLFSGAPGRSHTIRLSFDIGVLCNIPSQAAALIVDTSSYLSLNYSLTQITPDLSTYPLPFYERSFNPDQVRFVLPTQPSLSEATGILRIAAKLGDLTSNNVGISATLDTDLVNLVSNPSATLNEHLLVIGQPQNNQFLEFLNGVTNLPVSPHLRQMDLVTQGPATISANDTFTYVFSVTNTTHQTSTILLSDNIPPYTQFVECNPECAQTEASQMITWPEQELMPGQVISLSLTLTATQVVTGQTFENTVALIDSKVGPINVDALISTADLTTSTRALQTSASAKSDYFFIYNGQPVAENDGIIQEIISPWDDTRTILIVTGLNEAAIEKASYGLSSETEFPGMSGPVAFVQQTNPPGISSSATSPADQLTFQDLGYDNQLLEGRYTQVLDYFFYLPYGWQLTNDASVDFHFSHSALIDSDISGLSLLFNGIPIASTPLTQETAQDGRLKANLDSGTANPGKFNRITIQVAMATKDECGGSLAGSQIWFNAKNDSTIFLDHNELPLPPFDLEFYPSPFNLTASLVDVLFALPAQLTLVEWQDAINLAAVLGESAGGDSIVPLVALGERRPQAALADYHIIALGQPSRNPLISQVNDQLPQPFLIDSDQIEQRLDNVVFRLPPGLDLGYLQLIPSPWNEERAFLAVTGTTAQGVNWAARGLYNSSLVSELRGNLSLVQDRTIKSINTVGLLETGMAAAVATAMPELITSTVEATASPTPSPLPTQSVTLTASPQLAQNSRPAWLVPLIGVTVVIILAIFVIAFRQSRGRLF